MNYNEKLEYLKNLEARLEADPFWNMTDDHKYYMKMNNIWMEVVKFKNELGIGRHESSLDPRIG